MPTPIIPPSTSDPTNQLQPQQLGHPITTDYLLDSTAALKKPKGTIFMPHQLISRGDSNRSIEQGQATWAEYFAALRRITSNCAFTPTAQAAIYKHEEELALMAISWD